MNDYGVKAQKGWFMFDNEVVCLGAGIEAPDTEKELNTTVNQCNLLGDVYMIGADGTAAKVAPGSTVSQPISGWVWHNKVAYYFPQSTSVNLKTANQTGRWSKINFNQSGEEVSKPVFNLSIPHGSKPQQASYAYFIVPGIASPAMLKAYDTQTVEILSNTATLQAVHHKKLDIVEAIFYQPGTLTIGTTTLRADKPCIMLAKKVSTSNPEIIQKEPGK